MLNEIHIWERLNYYQSATTSQKYLKKNYKCNSGINADQKGYENALTFMYYLEHGELYYKQAEAAPLALKPVLLFYGLVHLIKACILAVDPEYPASTSVLAHGVTTRKRKKQQYRFLEDEVRIQKSGLCTHFADMLFHVKQLEGTKASMNELLLQIPELDDLFIFHSKANMYAIPKMDNRYCIPLSILDEYQMTQQRFEYFLKEKSTVDLNWETHNNNFLMFSISPEEKLTLPFHFHVYKELYTLPKGKHRMLLMPELIVHYLLLYNLSMIARYETEWWCELLKTSPNSDYPFIKTFLEITATKGPYLAWGFLEEKRLKS
ncbi:YaaC family protein [Heyndrickxia acidicola]|uniref:YaaC family protein n=1 Tax=Heyndrickxia acidicola TaxID=209389 RepID=A0ABU6MN22_9BACI|nr:YaaC family protein [Heyndrickxia acidicola]MED1206095.1 YaaC family protein [Heyndrickxia acidicola]